MDPIVSGAAANLSSETAKGIFQEVKRHVRYVIIYNKNVEKFEEKLETLMAKRTSVQQEVDAADRNGEKIKADVQHWSNKVDKVIEEEGKKVKDLQEKAKSRCFIGLCPSIKSQYQLSRKAEDGATAFEELIRQGQFNGSVGYLDVPQAMMDTHEPPKDFEAFKSREKAFNDLLEALKDPTLSMIGVYGMAGVGKTSLVKEVARRAKEAKLLDTVVMVIVSQTPDIQNIQEHVAEMLGLKLEEKSTVVRARRLCARLKKEKKILFVLDDVWARLDLEEVGIPFGNQHKGVKILLTSRDQNVLSNGMEAKKTFAVGVLDDEEAWHLFKKMAGDDTESEEFLPTAVEVAKRCGRLPLAISTVARALRNKRLFAWKDALRQLKRPSLKNFKGVSADVYSAIKLSYDHLESEELKQIFMLCSLLHRNSIEILLRYAIGLGLINAVNTVQEARDWLLTMVSKLKASCLLLDSNNGDGYFDMHDVVYDIAISIASEDNHVLAFRREDVLKDWPDGEIMEKCNKIYFEYPSISELPDKLNCPRLVIFVMYSKDLSLEIPTNFFRETVNLQVVDLLKMRFSSLPSSISLLTSLRTLCLDLCELGDVDIVKELKNLEILSFMKSDIRILPKVIGQLVKLKLLDLSHCTKLKIIPPGILPRLSRLEELYMGDTSIEWAAGGHANHGSNASLAELQSLPCLTTLEVHIPDANAIPGGLFFKKLQKLERYKIFIGKEWEWFRRDEYSRTLKLSLSTSMDHLEHGIKVLLKKTEDLYLNELKGVKIAMQNLKDEGGLVHLKNLHIQNGLEIKYIIDGNDLPEKDKFLQLKFLTLQGLPQLVSFCSEDGGSEDASSLFSGKVFFPCLETLRLSSINVERIWHNRLSVCTHENLSMLTIEGCNNLRHLLPISVARGLLFLKYFEIIGCQSLKEIIFTEDIEEENKAKILFPQLNSLKIRDLQHLIAFCSENHKVEFPSLKLLIIENCPELKKFIYNSREENQGFSCESLFDDKVSFPSLEEMRISNLRNMKIIWQNQLPENSFHRLRRLDVRGCDVLLMIFPSNMLRTFQAVQSLSVHNCASLEEVFDFGCVNMEETGALTSHLTQLSLSELPNLKHIWKNDPQGVFTFQNLCVVYVSQCWNLKNIFPASVARALAQLKELKLYSCGVEEIVSKDEGLETAATFVFPQVSSLKLWYLPELKCFYPGVHVTKWPMLRKLNVYKCDKMKILGTENRLSNIPDMSNNGQVEIQPLFLAEKVIPKLENLSLNCEDMAMIIDAQFPRSLFYEIKVLRRVSCGDESAKCHISVLERFDNLEKLAILYCDFEQLFPSEGDMSKETYARTLSTVRHLKLCGLDNLKYVWKEDVRVDQIVPNLETLKVKDCYNLITLGSSSTSFQNLTTLYVWRCKVMINLVTSSAVQGLAQLKKLVVSDCVSMEEIVGNDGDEGTNEIIFSNLKSLQLWDLPQLKSFCSGNHTFEFPSLEEVILGKCPQLEVFCKGVLKAPILERVQVTYDNHRGHWSGDLNRTVQKLYTKKVGYRGVDRLVLSRYSESIEMWTQNLQGVVDFKNIKYVELFGCNGFKYIFTVSMALNFLQCQEIKVKNCPMMEQIITDEGAEEAEMGTILLPRLKYIVIESCSNMTSFCTESITLECPSLQNIDIIQCPNMFALASLFTGEQEIDKVFCPNLRYLRLSSANIQNLLPPHLQVTWSNVLNLSKLVVIGCHNLKHLFVSSLVKNFAQLNQLIIRDCKNMEEVIYRDGLEEAEGVTQMLFPKLDVLSLKQLSKLEGFCRGENSESNTLALFNEKVAFPRLNHLEIVGTGNWKEIWDDKVITNSFPELSILTVKDCGRLLNVFTVNMMERLEKLDTLHIENCEALEEITGPHGLNSNESHAVTATGLAEDKLLPKFVFPKMKSLFLEKLPKLKSFNSKLEIFPGSLGPLRILCLSELPELAHLWKEEITPGEIFNDLIYLKVSACGNLKNLVPSSVSLTKLTMLEVSECHELRSLVTLTTAKSMVLLTRLSITDCQMLEDIIASTSDEVMGGIIFSQLKSLELGCLPSLSSFCSGNYTIKFPSLEEVIMRRCPKMELFSKGKLSTPMLQGIQSTRGKYVGCWEGNLNAVIQQLFVEKIFPTLEDLEISSMNIQRIWHGKLLSNSSFTQNLTCLTVEGCHDLNCLFSYSMVESLGQLKMLSIENCENVKKVVFIEGLAGEPKISKLFSKLEFLLLKDLPKLRRFCHGNYFELPLLRILKIESCPTLKTFISDAEGKISEVASPALFDEKVAFPSLEGLSIIGSGNWRKIWHNQSTNSVSIHFADH